MIIRVCRFEILYLESSDDVLIKRYKETRRFHPLSGKGGRVEQGIKEERKRLEFLRARADYLIDTSHMLTRELRAELSKIFVENKEYKNLYISVLSFGFKYGIPADADLVFDVRFLPNPYYIDDLRPKSGNDREVREYVDNGKGADIPCKTKGHGGIPDPELRAGRKDTACDRNWMYRWKAPLCYTCK